MAANHSDEGYAWIVLAAAFLGYAIQGGVVFCQALMYQAFLTKFGMTVADTGAIGATYASLLFMASKCLQFLGIHQNVALAKSHKVVFI